MDAMIFDFDGVVVDSEPIHLVYFQQILARVGLDITREAYYERYLGSDDHDAIIQAARDQGRQISEEKVAELIAEKTELIQSAFRSVPPQPGAVELIRAAAQARVPLAVCSGALREEIKVAARAVGVLDCFGVIVAAEDVARSKPDAQGYRLALERLAAAVGRPLRADKTVAVEDAPAGIQAAHAAGMKVLAVACSYAPEDLAAAERTVTSLAGVTLESLEELL